MADIDRLLEIMARLRDPEGGCPWDLEQDFASISPHTIEEAYEVDEAIESGDLEALRDELGDLLFQVVFQARIAEERGAFNFSGVVAAIVEKLVRRHPHVFADAETPDSVAGQLANWEEIKAAERAAAGKEQDGPADPLVGIPRSLPALARSSKIAGRIERLGREGAGPVDDASAAFKEALEAGRRALDGVIELAATEGDASASETSIMAPDSRAQDGVGAARAARARQVGIGLRAWVEIARKWGVDPEQALRSFDDVTIEEVRRGAL